jgi:heat shock protein HslJ
MKPTVWPLALFVLVASVTVSTAQEAPLICFGNEPFWRLDLIEPGKARFSPPDSEPVDYLGVMSTLEHRKESIWRGQTTLPDSGELVVFLRHGECSDTMSDTIHPYWVNVSLPQGSHYAGCCRLPEAPVALTTLENVTWRATALPGQNLPADKGHNAVTVNFEDGRVHGFSGCNQFIGPYTMDGERLAIGMLGGTMMACDEQAMSVEDLFLKSFSGALSISVAGNYLTLTPENGGEALRFERLAPPRLEGVEWEVTGFNNGRQAVVSPKTSSRLTLKFQDGQLAGNSGCNSFHGSYTVAGDSLTIHQLGTNRKACEAGLMAQEQEFFQALQSAKTWNIIRGMLDVHRADGERVLTANETAK